MLRLIDVKDGSVCIVTGINAGINLIRRLEMLNIRVGKEIRKVTQQPLYGPVVLEVDGRRITIGRGMASKILVEIKT